MKSTAFLAALILIASVPARAAERPNIVFMLADDQGWNGLSVPMHPHVADSRGDIYHTPHLEKLASQGMRFSAAYAPSPVCSPTRISLLTGKSPAALHWTKAAPPETGHKLLEPRNVKNIASQETTAAELLRQAGYATAHYGKWHINGGGPAQHGFDESDGDTGNENAFQFTDPNPVDIFGMADRAAAFMEKNLQARKPFFIQLSWNALHASENANKATLARYEQKLNGQNRKRITTAAITEDLDTGVGRVLEAIDRLGLSETTYVIYTSDNGAGGGKKVLRGGKGDLYEGGIRVPLIIRGPGVPPNSWCHTRVVGYDFFRTFCEWGNIRKQAIPQGVEGGSLVPLLAGRREVQRPREELLFHFPHYQGDTPHSAIILGDLKLLHFYEDDHDELYDLAQDPGERHNLATDRPQVARQLHDRLQTSLTAVNAQFPTPNPDYDPSRPADPPQRGGKGKKGKQPRK
jgi:arylsulfatase A